VAIKKLFIDGKSLTIDKIEAFLKEPHKLVITKESQRQINKSGKMVEKWVENNEVIYGVTTGFGEFVNVNISKDDIRKLQENLILSQPPAAENLSA
jgi:histidine ammonia-lyase